MGLLFANQPKGASLTLRDSVCAVTGASSGIGCRTALDLAARGARVCVVARRRDRLEELLAELGGSRAGHSLFACDVAQREQVKALREHMDSTYGRCDVLVNNAGYTDGRIFEGPSDIERLERVMATNFYGVVYCTGELLHLLLASAPSSVVNVSSVAGRLGLGGNSSYCASKFAVAGFSESLHIDLAGRDVCVSLVEPGFVPTEGFPHADLRAHPVMRHALSTVEDVSAAIIDAIENRRMERIVPRWYHLLQLPRIVLPPLHRWALLQLGRSRARRRGPDKVGAGRADLQVLERDSRP
ncbi:MAG: SDR family NAD(P)-dependent oxidoreductase [Actinomycetota bacterium]